MSDYSKTTNFGVKDGLTTGDANKLVKGSEFDTEFDAIAVAVATKSDSATPTFTGTVTGADLTLTGTFKLADTSDDHYYTWAVSELAADRTVTWPLLTGNDTLVFEDHTATLTNKTVDLTSNTLQGSKAEFNTALESDTFFMASDLLDEDNMASDSATLPASQQSIKAYVDASAGTGTVDTSGTPVASDLAVFTDANTIQGRSYAEIKADLSLEIGTDVQAHDAFLDDIAALTDPNDDRLLFWDDSGGGVTWLDLGTGLSITGTTISATTSGGDLVSTNNLSDVANAGTARTNLGVAIGSNVQAYDADLTTLGGLASTDGNFIVGSATGWVAENGATARTSLGLGIGSDVQAFGAVLDDLNTLGAATGDNQFLVSTGAGVNAWESGATARTSLGAQVQDAFLDDIAALTDPNDDRILFWDDSGGGVTWLDIGTNLTLTGTTLSADTQGLISDVQTFTTSGTWTKPADATWVRVECIGGGGGGANDTTTTSTYIVGGGGGGFAAGIFLASELGATETVTIGAGGAGGVDTVDNDAGDDGGDSTFGAHLTGRGGGGGSSTYSGSGFGGIGGGGERGGRNVTYYPYSQGGYSSGSGGTGANVGGNCVMGGAGGGGATSDAAGGSSVHGGDGGAGNDGASVAGTAGTAPGGGGGGSANDGGGGAGAAGQIIVWSW